MSGTRSDGTRSNYLVPMLSSAIRILETFYDSEADLSLHQVSAIAKVGKTSAFRILYTLDKLRYVEKDLCSGKYHLGIRIIAAARKTLLGGNLVRIVRPHIEKLRDEFDETANLAALRKDQIVYLEIFESPHALRMAAKVGSRVPWHSTALGKSIAAFLPEEKVKKVLKESPMKRFTPHTITNLREYLKVLARVRKQEYSLDNEESELGATCVATPIFDESTVIGALSISGPSPRIQEKQNGIITALKKVSATISESLTLGT